MRKKFTSDLYEIMKRDKNVILITADLGYGMFDKIRDDFPKQFYNVGAAEQAATDIAVGMVLSNKIAIVYSITPFFFRAFEGIRNYIDHEQIPVVLVGSGRGKDYKHEGFSHDASDDYILKVFNNIIFLTPDKDFDLQEIVYMKKPVYLNLKR